MEEPLNFTAYRQSSSKIIEEELKEMSQAYPLSAQSALFSIRRQGNKQLVKVERKALRMISTPNDVAKGIPQGGSQRVQTAMKRGKHATTAT